MESFKKVFRGYDEVEVRDFINKMNENFDDVSEKQKDRIEDLKKQNEQLQKELNEFKKREKLIEKTIVQATQKASEMDNEIKMQYAIELERLKIFQAKWTNSYEELKQKYHFDKDVQNMENLVVTTKQHLLNKLQQELNISLPSTGTEPEKQFNSEYERLDKMQEEQADKLVAQLKKEIDSKNDKEEFDLEKALIPDKSLKELCKDMGI